MKPSREQVLQAVVSIGEIIPFFPKGSLSDDLIVECLLEFIGDERQLEWFANAAVRRLSKYEGIPQLRRLFCIKYQPADGIQPIFDDPAEFAAQESMLEAQYRMREMEENDRRLAEYRRQAALAPPEDREPLLLPEPKMIPTATTAVVLHQPRETRSLRELEAEVAALPKSPVRSEEERLRAVQELEETLRKLPRE